LILHLQERREEILDYDRLDFLVLSLEFEGVFLAKMKRRTVLQGKAVMEKEEQNLISFYLTFS
jgi:hypothetical protein